jgi:hypothetical protein
MPSSVTGPAIGRRRSSVALRRSSATCRRATDCPLSRAAANASTSRWRAAQRTIQSAEEAAREEREREPLAEHGQHEDARGDAPRVHERQLDRLVQRLRGEALVRRDRRDEEREVHEPLEPDLRAHGLILEGAREREAEHQAVVPLPAGRLDGRSHAVITIAGGSAAAFASVSRGSRSSVCGQIDAIAPSFAK